MVKLLVSSLLLLCLIEPGGCAMLDWVTPDNVHGAAAAVQTVASVGAAVSAGTPLAAVLIVVAGFAGLVAKATKEKEK